MLSRNKTIKLLHSLTNDSYKKCRAALKANNWDINRVLFPEFYSLKDCVDAINDGIKRFNNAVAEAVNNTFTPLINAINETFSEAEGLEQDV